VLASQWVPLDRELWRFENYREFLAERRRFLAAANRFVDELLNGSAATPAAVSYSTVLEAASATVADLFPSPGPGKNKGSTKQISCTAAGYQSTYILTLRAIETTGQPVGTIYIKEKNPPALNKL
jgi:hypothetical protein